MGHRHGGGLALGRTGVPGTPEPSKAGQSTHPGSAAAFPFPIDWVERFSMGGPLSGSFKNNQYKSIHINHFLITSNCEHESHNRFT